MPLIDQEELCDGASTCFHLPKSTLPDSIAESRSYTPAEAGEASSSAEASSSLGVGNCFMDLGENTSTADDVSENDAGADRVAGHCTGVADDGANSCCDGSTPATVMGASSDDDTEEEGSELSESEMESDYCFLQVST